MTDLNTLLVAATMLAGIVWDRVAHISRQVVVVEEHGPPAPLLDEKRRSLARYRAQQIANENTSQYGESIDLRSIREKDPELYLLVMEFMPQFSKHWK